MAIITGNTRVSNGVKLTTVYSHVGQHSEACEEYINECKQAKYNEYQDLLKELISLGYNISVLNNQQIATTSRPAYTISCTKTDYLLLKTLMIS